MSVEVIWSATSSAGRGCSDSLLFAAMAEPRRVQLTTLSSNVPLQSAVVVKPALPPKEAVTVTPVAASTSSSWGSLTKQPVATSISSSQGSSTKLVTTERFVLTLFEPDQHRCPEFYYPELVYKKVRKKDDPFR